MSSCFAGRYLTDCSSPLPLYLKLSIAILFMLGDIPPTAHFSWQSLWIWAIPLCLKLSIAIVFMPTAQCSSPMRDFLNLCSSFLSQTEHCHRVFTGRHSTACSSRWRRRTLSSSSATSSPLLSGLSWHPSVVREKWDLQPDCRFLVNSFFDVHADDCNGWVAVASCILF